MPRAHFVLAPAGEVRIELVQASASSGSCPDAAKHVVPDVAVFLRVAHESPGRRDDAGNVIRRNAVIHACARSSIVSH